MFYTAFLSDIAACTQHPSQPYRNRPSKGRWNRRSVTSAGHIRILIRCLQFKIENTCTLSTDYIHWINIYSGLFGFIYSVLFQIWSKELIMWYGVCGNLMFSVIQSHWDILRSWKTHNLADYQYIANAQWLVSLPGLEPRNNLAVLVSQIADPDVGEMSRKLVRDSRVHICCCEIVWTFLV